MSSFFIADFAQFLDAISNYILMWFHGLFFLSVVLATLPDSGMPLAELDSASGIFELDLQEVGSKF